METVLRFKLIFWKKFGTVRGFSFAKQALEAPKVILAIDYKNATEREEKRPPSPSPPPTEPEPVKVEAPVQTPDLLVILAIL